MYNFIAIEDPKLSAGDCGALVALSTSMVKGLKSDPETLYVTKDGRLLLFHYNTSTSESRWYRLDVEVEAVNPMLDRAICELNSTDW